MKRILTLLLGIALILPLYSQETVEEGITNLSGDEVGLAEESEEEAEEQPVEPKKEKRGFARQHWVLGSDLGVGFDNGIIGTSDIFQKNIVIDMSELANSMPQDGAGINFDLFLQPIFFEVMNIHIGQGLWNFGFTVNIDGGISLNISKSLFELIAEGNAENHDNSGKISASGGIFTEIGLTGSAEYQVAGRALRAGIKPAIFTPAVYIPSSSGISYDLSVKKDGKDGLFLSAEGEISVYLPTSFDDKMQPGRFAFGPTGFDISLEGEYELFPSLSIGSFNIGALDVGLGLNNIPFAPATLTTEMKMALKPNPFNIDLYGEDIIQGNDPKIPEFDFDEPTYNYNASKKVHRLFNFDAYVRYKPFKTELLVLRPNIGFSVNGNEGDKEGFFNAGLEAKLNLKDIFTFYLGSGYHESTWKQRLGLGLNLRVFEFDLEVALRDHTFAGCFKGHGFNLMLGTRIGW